MEGSRRVAEPAYPGARVAAARVHPHFERHTPESAATPDVGTIEAMIDAAFWASLRREEGYIPAISLAYVAPDQAPLALRLERPLPLAPQ